MADSLVTTEIADLQKQRASQVLELNKFNSQLASAKLFHRGGIKKAIRNVEQSIRKIDARLRQLQNAQVRVEGLEQGIDVRSNAIGASGNLLGQALSGASGIISASKGGKGNSFIANPLTGILGSSFDASFSDSSDSTKSSNSNIFMIVIVAIVAFLFLKND